MFLCLVDIILTNCNAGVSLSFWMYLNSTALPSGNISLNIIRISSSGEHEIKISMNESDIIVEVITQNGIEPVVLFVQT